MIYSESDLIIPALIFISSQEAGIKTSALIKKLENLLKPGGKDAQLLSGRNDTHFSQKVRNLVSHKKLTGKGLAIYSKLGKDGLFKITPLGQQYIINNGDSFDFIINNGFNNKQREEIIKNNFSDLLIEEGYIKLSQTVSRERSKKLVEIAKKYFAVHNKIYCKACNFNFENFYGDIGKGFIEIHHIKPIFTYENKITQSLNEALKNVVPLCSNCHRMIHKNNSNPLTISKLKEKIIG